MIGCMRRSNAVFFFPLLFFSRVCCAHITIHQNVKDKDEKTLANVINRKRNQNKLRLGLRLLHVSNRDVGSLASPISYLVVRKGAGEKIAGKESSTPKRRQGVENISMIVLATDHEGGEGGGGFVPYTFRT